jgi:hypothetical protein
LHHQALFAGLLPVAEPNQELGSARQRSMTPPG